MPHLPPLIAANTVDRGQIGQDIVVRLGIDLGAEGGAHLVDLGLPDLAGQGRLVEDRFGRVAGQAVAVHRLGMAAVGQNVVKVAAEGGIMHKALGLAVTKTPLRNFALIHEAGELAGKLSVKSLWSTIPQGAVKAYGLAVHAPNLYHQVTGS